MNSSIPYHPSLALGSVISLEAMDTMNKINDHQRLIDTSQDTLNSFITLRRNLEVTERELSSLRDIDTEPLKAEMREVNKSIIESALAYSQARREHELGIRPLRAELFGMHQSIESPVDFDRTRFKALNISGDSLKLDSQFFSFAGNKHTDQTMVMVKDFLTSAVESKNIDNASGLIATGIDQIERQRKSHKVLGTLIITAHCTHRLARVSSPLVIDPDKAIGIWNRAYKDTQDRIDTSSPDAIRALAMGKDGEDKALNVITGATYASTFIGMVHMLSENTSDAEKISEKTIRKHMEKLQQEQALKAVAGGFGPGQMLEEIQSLLTDQTITSHVTLLVSGQVPKLKSSMLSHAVQQFTRFKSDEMLDKLTTLSNASHSEHSTSQSESDQGRKAALISGLEGAKFGHLIGAVANAEGKGSNALDINSLMSAFDSFVESINKNDNDSSFGAIGVPASFFIEPLTRKTIARLWVQKYVMKISQDNEAAADVDADDPTADSFDADSYDADRKPARKPASKTRRR